MQFRKKPVVVEVVQLGVDGPQPNWYMQAIGSKAPRLNKAGTRYQCAKWDLFSLARSYQI